MTRGRSHAFLPRRWPLLGKPEGEAGPAVGERLNRVNADITAAVYQRLQLRPSRPCPGNRLRQWQIVVRALLAYAHDLTYAGIDIAETWSTEAIAFNAELVAAGRASFRWRREAIPCPDQSFDQGLRGQDLFWPDPGAGALGEMRRVLRPGAERDRRVKPDPISRRPRPGETFCVLRRGKSHLAASRRRLRIYPSLATTRNRDASDGTP